MLPAQSSEVVAGFFRALHTGLGFAVRVANLACRNSGCKCNGRNAAPDEAATSSSITGERATMAAAGRSAARRSAADDRLHPSDLARGDFVVGVSQ